MLAIDAEVIAIAGFIGVTTDHFIGRARPSERECARDPNYERFCNQPDSFSSFISGHSVIAAASAGAICAHHTSMPLYGGGLSDTLACAAASLVAVTTGLARIANDRHWASDVLVAWLIGASVGYVWPKWFHYRSRSTRDQTQTCHWLPQLGPGSIAATCLGTF